MNWDQFEQLWQALWEYIYKVLARFDLDFAEKAE